eukprot:EG_transcript_14863
MVILAGVEGGGTTWVAALAQDDPWNIVDRADFPTTTPAETLAQVKRWLAERQFDALGVSTFGPVDPKVGSPTYGHITTTPKPLWGNTDVLGPLWDKSVPCRFDTDVNAPALAEFLYNRRPGDTSAVYITVGTGIGVGVVVNGEPVHGLLHPEGGHLPIARLPGDEFPGTCPFHGACVEGLASSGAVARRKGCATADLPALADDDPVWDHCAHALAALCASLVLVVSPQRIVISGGLMQRASLFDKVRARLLAILAGYIDSPALKPATVADYVVPSKWGNTAGIVGALTLAQLALRGERQPGAVE